MQIFRQFQSDEQINLVQFTPCDTYLTSVCGRTDILVFDTTGDLTPDLRFSTGYRTIYTPDIAIHPQRTWLCVSALEGQVSAEQMTVKVFNWFDGTVEREYMVDAYENQTTCFSPDGKWLVFFTSNGVGNCVLIEKNRVEREIPTEETNCFSCFHPNSNTLMISYYRASWQWGCSIDFWDIETQTLPAGAYTPEERQESYQEAKRRGSIELLYDSIKAAVFSPDGNLIGVSHWHPALYSYPEKQFLKAFDLEGQCLDHSFGTHQTDEARFWTKPVFTPDSRSMLCGSPDGIIFQWDVRSGRLLDKSEAHNGRVLDISLSSDGKTLASCGTDNLLKLWRPAV